MTLALQPEIVLSLEERAVRITGLLQMTALEVGRELLGAKRDHPGRFIAWVGASMPFGLDKAERCMAVSRAFDDADDEVKKCLPAAWSTLFELSRLPSERFQLHLEAGDVNPGMKLAESRQLVAESDETHPDHRPTAQIAREMVLEPRLTTDLVAMELMRLPREDLSASIETMLRLWLEN